MGPWRDPGPLNDKLQRCALRHSPQNYACVIVSGVVYKYLDRIAFKRTSLCDLVVQKHCTVQSIGNKCNMDHVLESVNDIVG